MTTFAYALAVIAMFVGPIAISEYRRRIKQHVRWLDAIEQEWKETPNADTSGVSPTNQD